MGKIPAFISNGLWLLLKNLLVFFQVPLSQHLGKLSWKMSVYHSGRLGNNFVTLCFSSALRLWKLAAPENEAQKGLIHGENIHLFHRWAKMTGYSFTDPPSVLSYVSGRSLEAALHIESCVLAHKEDVPGEGVCKQVSHTRKTGARRDLSICIFRVNPCWSVDIRGYLAKTPYFRVSIYWDTCSLWSHKQRGCGCMQSITKSLVFWEN